LRISQNRYNLGMKPLRFVGTSYEELCAFPREVYRNVGRALMVAQLGEKAPNAKPLKGFGGAAVPRSHRGP
jgi:phage-related protein